MDTDNIAPIARLIAWHTGEGEAGARPGGTTRSLVLSDAGQLEPAVAAGLVGQDTVVLLPPGLTPPEDGPGQVLVYDGPIATPSTEITIGEDFYLYCQDYATSEYLSVIGPTIVGIFTEDDFRALIRDADAARAEGTIPEFLRSPAVRIANVPALRGAVGDGPRQRLFVGPDGVVSTSTVGRRIGDVSDGMTTLEEEWLTQNTGSAHPCAVCLGGAVAEDVRSDAVAQRPWLGRYLTVLDTVRELAVRGVADVSFSGFGGRLNDGLTRDPGLADDDGADRPLLAWNDHEAFLRDPVRRKTFRFNRDAAEAVEAVIATGSVEAAATLVPQSAAARAADQLAAYGLNAAATGEVVNV
ncbi:daptide biosynthesis RiPP recognition protein [Georgenia sunbinii]|uniref:daptide biosynthesis RiPP recognition protein n=1 Tax=Georgenia sunbinii TaxID=3117728 RepID=UPI002F265D63